MNVNIKKIILPSLPYVLFLWLFDKVGQAFRFAAGADISAKIINLGGGFNAAFENMALSLHLLDLCVGIVGMAVILLAVYFKGKNAKKYRQGMYERNGEPLEVIAKHFIRTKFLLPKERPYQTNNFYAALMRQNRLEKEVKAIVKNKKNRPAAKADPCPKAGN